MNQYEKILFKAKGNSASYWCNMRSFLIKSTTREYRRSFCSECHDHRMYFRTLLYGEPEEVSCETRNLRHATLLFCLFTPAHSQPNLFTLQAHLGTRGSSALILHFCPPFICRSLQLTISSFIISGKG